MNRISRSLISVSDKTGVVELARGLSDLGVEILSTGGTADLLRREGIPVVRVEDYTASAEMFDGRVKTLHPKVFGGILHLRDRQDHLEDARRHGILPIDLVAVNLYPFAATVAKPGVTFEEAVENIDIGGVSLLRAAAKNARFVTVLCDPADYGPLLEELRATGGVSEATNLRLARKAFAATAAYDSLIASWLGKDEPGLPETLCLAWKRGLDLRYGENPHQKAAFYIPASASGLPFVRHHGKELSYNNLLDIETARSLASELGDAFGRPACVIIKHNNPCGAAVDPSPAGAFRKAFASDPLSAYGGIVGCSRAVDAETARLLAEHFLEVVCAPDFSADALDILRAKRNLRLVAFDSPPSRLELRTASGGLLVQEPDRILAERWERVSRREASPEELEQLRFAFLVCKFVKSNAIVLAKDFRTLGVGAGQMSRIDAARAAFAKAKETGADTSGAVMASDAFFPFPDCVELAAEHGVGAVVHPGGSVRDAESVEAADRLGLSLYVTGTRHFRH